MKLESVTNLSFRPQFMANFTDFEKRLMNDAREYSHKNNVETWRLIKRGKDITDQYTLIESYNSCGGYLTKTDKIFGISTEKLGKVGKFIKIFRNRINFINITHIHTHPREMSFSPTDIRNGLFYLHKKDIVVTPSGKYAVIEYDISKRRKGLKQIRLWDEWFEQRKYLYEGVKKEDKYKITQKILPEFLDNFFKETGIRYESNIEWTPGP